VTIYASTRLACDDLLVDGLFDTKEKAQSAFPDQPVKEYEFQTYQQLDQGRAGFLVVIHDQAEVGSERIALPWLKDWPHSSRTSYCIEKDLEVASMIADKMNLQLIVAKPTDKHP
jgi:hypothetical protein